MDQPLLAADQGNDLRFRVQGDTEAPAVITGKSLAEFRDAVVVGIAVVAGVAGGLAKGLDDEIRGGQVGVADAQVDDVHSPGPHLGNPAFGLGLQIHRQAGHFLR